MAREIKVCERLSSSVDKTLSILECISQHAKGLSLAEVVRLVGIPKTTAHRILEILLAREYVIWHKDSEQYSIGIKTLEIGLSGLIGQDIVEVSIPYLRELSEKIGEFLIYKFNVDIFLSAIIDVVLSTITKSRNKKFWKRCNISNKKPLRLT